MPPQSDSPSLYLRLQPQTFFLVQFKASGCFPAFLTERLTAPLSDGEFISVTRTSEEISVVANFRIDGGVEPATEWRCIRVAGPMNLGLVGIMNDLTAPLKTAKIPIFVISTWDTDWLLVPHEKGDAAADILSRDGWIVQRV